MSDLPRVDYITITEAAKRLKISRQAIYSRIDSGNITLAKVKVEQERVVWDDKLDRESRKKLP